MHNWLEIGANEEIISALIASGGIPASVTTNNTTMDRVWVKVFIDEVEYFFDPAFKTYTTTAKIDLPSAMDYDKAELLSAVGGEIGTDYVRNLNDNALRAKLVEHSTNLIDFLRVNYPNAKIDEIIGNREIIPENINELPTSLRFSNTPLESWDEVPNIYLHKVRIQHGEIDETLSIPEIAGKKLAITYDAQGNSAAAYSAASYSPPDVQIADTPSSESLPGLILSAPFKEAPGGYTTQGYQGTVDFGRIYNTSNITWSITLSNPSSNPTLNVTSSLSNNSSGAYSIIAGGGSRTIAPGGSLIITVQFSGSGQSRGTKTATFNLDCQWSLKSAPISVIEKCTKRGVHSGYAVVSFSV